MPLGVQGAQEWKPAKSCWKEEPKLTKYCSNDKRHTMKIENRSSQWPFSLSETLAMLVVVVVTVIVGDQFGFIYGLAFAVIGGVSAGLAMRFTRSKQKKC